MNDDYDDYDDSFDDMMQRIFAIAEHIVLVTENLEEHKEDDNDVPD